MKHFLYRIFKHNYANAVIFILAVVAAGLVWIGNKQLNAFQWQQQQLAVATAKNAADQIAGQIDTLQRSVVSFAQNELDNLHRLKREPDNQPVYNQLYSELKNQLPHLTALSVLDSEGNPIPTRHHNHIAVCCLDENGSLQKQKLFQPFVYELDNTLFFGIVFNFNKTNPDEFLFVSVDSQLFLDLLGKIQPDQNHLIIKNDNTLPPQGFSFQQNINFSIALPSPDTAEHIVTKAKVSNIDWIVYNFVNKSSFALFKKTLIRDSVMMFFLVFALGIFLIWRLRLEELDRLALEQQKTDMLGVIAHEFRSPLTAISGSLEYLNLLGEEPDTRDDRKTLLAMVNYNSARMVQLVNDFLLIEELESATFKLERTPVEINALVKRVITANEMYGKKFGVNFRLIAEPETTLVNCDAGRVEQVLTNFMSNAVKYGGENKSVDVSIAKSSRSIRISVRDYGPGIADQLKEKLFEKFGVNKAFRSKKVESSGLGLSICRAIIEKHGGRIGFDSTIGKGTTFYFDLPRTSTSY